MTIINATIEQLKAEGNKLFAANDFEAASTKYTIAIEALTANKDLVSIKLEHSELKAFLGVLFGNRAACAASIADKSPTFKKDSDAKKALLKSAIDDAWLSTELKENWPKGLLRLARLLDKANSRDNILVLERAKKAAIASNDPLRAEIEQELEKATSFTTKLKVGNTYLDKMKAAVSMWYPMHGTFAQAVLLTCNDFEAGMKKAKELKLNVVNGMVNPAEADGEMGGLQELANAILGESAGVAFEYGFDKLLEKYIFFDCVARGSVYPPFQQTADEIVALYVSRRSSVPNWNQFRPMYSNTIRAAIVITHMYALGNQHENALKNITMADQLIQKLQAEFRDVPKDDKGAVLLPSYHRLVRQLRVQMLHLQNKDSCDKEGDDISRALIKEVKADKEPCHPEAEFLYKTLVLFKAHSSLAGSANKQFNKSIQFKRGLDHSKMHTIDADIPVLPEVKEAYKEYKETIAYCPIDHPSRPVFLHHLLRFALLKGGLRYGDLKALHQQCIAAIDLVDKHCKKLHRVEDALEKQSVDTFKTYEAKVLAQMREDEEVERREAEGKGEVHVPWVFEDRVLGPISIAYTNYYPC